MEPFDRTQSDLDYCNSYATEYLLEKGKKIVYKCTGHIYYTPHTDFISCTETEKSILQSLKKKEPNQDLSYLLETNGYDDLAQQIAGDEGFWLYDVDWTPLHTYKFSIIRFSKYSFLKRREREIKLIYLDDEEYVKILSRRLMVQDYSFTSLQAEYPDLAVKIMNQISSPEEYGGSVREPYVLFMDEIEEDALKIVGPPFYTIDLCEYNCGDAGGIYITLQNDILTVVKEEKDECELLNVQTGYMSSYFENKEELSDIPCKPFINYFNETDYELLLDKLEAEFVGSEGFEKIRQFMDEQKITYTYKTSKNFV